MLKWTYIAQTFFDLFTTLEKNRNFSFTHVGKSFHLWLYNGCGTLGQSLQNEKEKESDNLRSSTDNVIVLPHCDNESVPNTSYLAFSLLLFFFVFF